MFDIADKEKLIQSILNEIEYPNAYISCAPGVVNIDDIKYAIERCINDQTREVVRAIIHHLYTNQEFESDIGLTK